MATRSLSRLGLLAALPVALALPAAAIAGSSGNAAAGRVLFEKRCQRCHTIGRLAGLGDLVRGDLRRIDERMSVVGLLWNEEVAHLRAYLNAMAPPEPPQGETGTQ